MSVVENEQMPNARAAAREAAWLTANWQPIDTAPRDGTSILTVDADGGMYVVDWDETLGKGLPATTGHCWWGTEGSGKYGFHTSTFVAWLPLPEPPR